MRVCRSVALLFFLFVAFGRRPVPAEEMRIPTGLLQPDRLSVSLAGYSAPDDVPEAPVPESESEESAAGEPEKLPVLQEAPPTGPLTVEDLQRIASENNPTLVQAGMAVQAAEGRYVQSGLYPNPAIGYAGGDVGLDDTSGQQGGFVSQEFVTAGKLRLGRAVASHEVQQAQCGREAQRWKVWNDVRAGYYGVLVTQKLIEVSKQLVRIGEEDVQATERLKAAGEVGRADVLQVRIEAEKAALDLIQARNQYRAAWQQLTAVLGSPDLEPTLLLGDVDANLPKFDYETSLQRLLTQSPQLTRARAGVERARCDLALQYAERIPNFEVEAGAKYDESASYSLADVAVVLPIPIFNRNQGNIIEAQAGLIDAENEVQRIDLDLREKFAAVFEQYANARRQVKTYTETILPHAKESLDLIRTGHREGEFGYLDLLTAQRTYFGVSLDYLSSLGELWARSVELEGLLLTGSLEGVE